MFPRGVDQVVTLALAQASFAAQMEVFSEQNFSHLSKWLPWPTKCKTQAQFAEFIQPALHGYADCNSECYAASNGSFTGSFNGAKKFRDERAAIKFFDSLTSKIKD